MMHVCVVIDGMHGMHGYKTNWVAWPPSPRMLNYADTDTVIIVSNSR